MPRLAPLLLLLPAALHASEVTVTLSGEALDVNGTREVPIGLFGTHAVALTPELIADLGVTTTREIFYAPGGGTRRLTDKGTIDPVKAPLPLLIDCQGDRFNPPLSLTAPGDWAERAAAMGRQYGETWRRLSATGPLAGTRGVVQWWNEPYLNWAERSAGEGPGNGSTINQEYYDLSRAVEGGPVHVKGRAEPLRVFRWRSLWPVRYADHPNSRGKMVKQQRLIGFSIPMPAGATVGTVFTAAETRYWRRPRGVPVEWRVERIWMPVDPTATGFWSGEQNLDFYSETFAAWAQALRTANPEVVILAGWDYNFDAGDWQVWRSLYRPLLERHPHLIDGLTEHHYGIPPESVQAWHEVAAADSAALLGKPMKVWNTECQGVLDPAVFGAAANASGQSATTAALWEARYNLADIIGLAARMPDKTGSRTIHRFVSQQDFPRSGGAFALRLLRELRGPLVAVDSSDPRVWAVAARGSDGRVRLAIANQRPEGIEVDLRGQISDVQLSAVVLAGTTGALAIRRHPAGGMLRIASRDAVLIDAAMAAPTATRRIRQIHASGGALPRAGADEAIRLAIPVPATAAGARRAWLRISATGRPDGDARTPGRAEVRLGGTVLQHDGTLPVMDLAIDPGLAAPGQLALAIQPATGTTLAAASLLVELADPR